MASIEQGGRIVERSPYLQGSYAPVHTEITAHDLPVTGELPGDLEGMYVRTGANPLHEPDGRYHWFDGDAMLHGVHIANGSVTYRNRWIRTSAFNEELRAGGPLWKGILERPDFTRKGGPYKDTANTTLTFHNGKLLAHWWLSGSSYVISTPELDTIGTEDFGGYDGKISAHPKVDPRTGDLLFFDYAPTPPYLTYGEISADGRIRHVAPITLDGPRLQHDLAITERYAILLDMSLMWDPEALKQGKILNGFFRDKPTRFGIIPRRGTNDDVRWFDASPCFMYHTINAWEDGDEIVVVGCKIPNPLANDPNMPHTDRIVPAIATLRLEPYLHEWRFNLVTGLVKEETLDGERLGEFPTMDDRSLGAPTRIAYVPRMAPAETLLFDGLIRYDHVAGTSEDYSYPAGWYGGEVAFAPRRAASAREDDGYLLTFAAEEATGSSELYVFDAANVTAGPVCRVPIPQRVPTGYHTEWIAKP